MDIFIEDLYYSYLRGSYMCIWASLIFCLTLKRLEGGFNLIPPRGFSRNVFFRETVKPWFLVTFNIIISDIFPENSIVIPQVDQKLWRSSSSIFAILSIFRIFWHFLVSKKLMTSEYNKWHQYFFTLNLLWIGCLSVV